MRNRYVKIFTKLYLHEFFSKNIEFLLKRPFVCKHIKEIRLTFDFNNKTVNSNNMMLRQTHQNIYMYIYTNIDELHIYYYWPFRLVKRSQKAKKK